MSDSREPAASGPDKSDHKKAPVEAPIAGDELLPLTPFGDFLALQRSLGNRVVARFIERGGARTIDPRQRVRQPLLAGSSRVQRETPNATMPPPNKSEQPQAPAVRNNGITYQGEMLYPDSQKCKATLKKLLAEKGREGASSWGTSMLNPTNEVKAGWSLFADDSYIESVQGAMRTAVTEFDEECRIFMEKFETVAGNTTDAMLINAEKTIQEEQKKLGLKSEMEVSHQDRDITTTYSATNPAYLADAKAAARALAEKRSLADFRAGRAAEARKKAEQVRAQMPSGFDPNSLLPPSGTAPSGPINLGGQPVVVVGPMLTEQEMTHKSWREAEDDFKKAAAEATGKYALLGPLLSGGGGTVDRLRAFAAENSAQSAQDLGTQFAEKLKNIETVRGELGKRFSIWKQPQIISITHQQMNSGPGEQRMVRDKAKQVAEDEKSTKEMYAAIALGLGLLATIGTMGAAAPALAAIATAATVSGAALSAYTTYEEAQEYLLQSATANTSLDRANEISKDDPSFLWLAMDIAFAITDLGAAKAALVGLKSTIAAAKAAKSAQALPELVGAMRRASISPTNQAKVINEVLPSGGDIGKALHDIRQAFISTAKTAADKETAEIMRHVAERALNQGKVIVLPPNKMEALEVLRLRLKGRPGIDVDAKANEILKDFFAQSANVDGMFYGEGKFIVLRGNQSVDAAAAVLIHELTHSGQDTMKIMNSMGAYRSEFEAFKAQQQFLNLLPPDRVAAAGDWPLKLWRMNDAQIEEHIKTAYVSYGAIRPDGFDSAAMADGIFNTLFQAASAK